MKAWWQRRTLRFRLAAWYSIGGFVLIAAFSATVYAYVSTRVASPLDQVLRQEVPRVREHLSISPEGEPAWDGVSLAMRPNAEWLDTWFEVWDERGHLVRRVWPLEDDMMELPPLPPSPGRETFSIINVASDLRLRSLSVPLDVPGARPGWMLRIMRLHVPAQDALRDLLVVMGLALPAVTALLVFGGYLVTRRWLDPLDRMVVEATKITAHDLSRRLPVENQHDELGRLASVFNFTLDRLQQAFITLDRFAADASHELKTPLTTLRSVGEVGLRRGRTVEEYREIIGSMLEESQRLQLLIQRLLELARAERGPENVQRSEVAVDELVAGCIADMSVLAEHQGQRLRVASVPCTASTDPVLLGQAIRNLLDNAIKYSPPGSTIDVRVECADGRGRISVTDEGPGIPAEYRQFIAERFFRTDHARERLKGGFGLGLAITKAYMRVLGGSLEFEPAGAHGSIFRLAFPLAREGEVAAASGRS